MSKLARRTWGPVHFTLELLEHLDWWRAYYHFVRFHESLAVTLAYPKQRKGKQQLTRYQNGSSHDGRANVETLDGKGIIELSFAVI